MESADVVLGGEKLLQSIQSFYVSSIETVD